MKVKSAEQYKALRKRETKKRHKRNRTGKTRASDIHGWTMGALIDDFGPEGVGKYIGHYNKPNHAKRAVDIRSMMQARTDTTEGDDRNGDRS